MTTLVGKDRVMSPEVTPASTVPTKISAVPTKIMLLDTASLYFRAFFGVPNTIKAPDGTPVNALRGLLEFISRLVDDHQPTHLVAAWDDDWRPQFRVELIPSYKAHRVVDQALETEEVPDELSPQVPLIIQALELLGIARIGVPGYEADDIIGTLAATTKSPVLIVTGDRDLFQLVDNAQPITVLYTAAKGVGAAERIDDEAILLRYGIHSHQYSDYALLRGDSSDGLPGVRGIGEKTAARLIDEFGSVTAIYAAIDEGTAKLAPGVTRNLLDGRDYAGIARGVVEVVKDIEIPTFEAVIPAASPDPQALADFAAQWGVTSSVERVRRSFGW